VTLLDWAKDGPKPGGFWMNQPDEPAPLDYDIYDDSAATDEDRRFALRLMHQVWNDRNDYYDIAAKAVAAALAACRSERPSA
jgi:hypothetical protein